jgi:hypothetical protein
MSDLKTRAAEYLAIAPDEIAQVVESDGEAVVITIDMRKYRIPLSALPEAAAADDRPASKTRSKPGR